MEHKSCRANAQICIIDGKAYSALQSANREQDETEVEACILATNNQGKELLLPGRGSHQHNAEKWVIVALANGEAYLPDLTITGTVSYSNIVFSSLWSSFLPGFCISCLTRVPLLQPLKA